MTTTDNDDVLLGRWCEGDAGAGQTLIARHYPSVLRYFELNASWAADDLAQRTFLACAERVSEVRDRSMFRAFVMGVARRQLAMYLRGLSRKRGPEHFEDPLPETRLSTLVARNQQQFLLLRAFVDLPRKPQLLLILFYWEQLPGTEIATSLEIPESTFRSRLARARDLLRRRMEALLGRGERVSMAEPELALLIASVRSDEAIDVPDARELKRTPHRGG